MGFTRWNILLFFYAAYEGSNVKVSVIHEKTSNYGTQDRKSYQSCSVKKVFLKISQILQENTCARVSFLIKLQASGTCFSVNFARFIRIPFMQSSSGRLLLTRRKKLVPSLYQRNSIL